MNVHVESEIMLALIFTTLNLHTHITHLSCLVYIYIFLSALVNTNYIVL